MWEYKGGCYENGKVEHYVPGEPGAEYTFESLAIEGREGKQGLKIGEDPGADTISGSLSVLLWRIGILCFIASLVLMCFLGY